MRRETSIGYESRKCTLAVEGGLWGVIRSLQSDINICYPPSFQLPKINEDLPSRKVWLRAGYAGSSIGWQLAGYAGSEQERLAASRIGWLQAGKACSEQDRLAASRIGWLRAGKTGSEQERLATSRSLAASRIGWLRAE